MQTIKKVCEPSLFVFSAKYFLTNVFGAYAAHFSVCECGSDAVPVSEAKDATRNFALMTSEHALFTRLLLVKEGRISLEVGHTEVELLPCSVLAVTPGDGAEIKAVSPEFDAEFTFYKK